MISLGVLAAPNSWKNEPTYRFWVMTRRRWPSSAEPGAGASDNRARAKNAVTSRSRHRPIAAQNLSYIADLLMRLSLALSAKAVGLSVIRFTGGQSKGRRNTRMIGW